jgi:hypothetical protein
MEVPIFLSADYANQERAGKLNVLGIFNIIKAKKFPVRHRTMYLVLRVAAQLGEYDIEHEMKILFLNQDGDELGRQEGNFTIPRPESGTQGTIDLIIEVGDLILPALGRYEFRLIINKDVKAVIPLDVVQVESPSEQQ